VRHRAYFALNIAKELRLFKTSTYGSSLFGQALYAHLLLKQRVLEAS
jgi:hypothetical protein